MFWIAVRKVYRIRYFIIWVSSAAWIIIQRNLMVFVAKFVLSLWRLHFIYFTWVGLIRLPSGVLFASFFLDVLRCTFVWCWCGGVDGLDHRNSMQSWISINQEAVSTEQHDGYKQIFAVLVDSTSPKNAAKIFPRQWHYVYIFCGNIGGISARWPVRNPGKLETYSWMGHNFHHYICTCA
jgi:hypothetical protein